MAWPIFYGTPPKLHYLLSNTSLLTLKLFLLFVFNTSLAFSCFFSSALACSPVYLRIKRTSGRFLIIFYSYEYFSNQEQPNDTKAHSPIKRNSKLYAIK